MKSLFGRRLVNQHWVDQSPSSSPNAAPPIAQKVYHNRSDACEGCPYPRHGFLCHSKGDKSCLRTDMREIAERERRKKDGT